MSEKIREQTFWEKMKRFFGPVLENKFQTFLLILYFLFEGIFAVISIVFVQRMIYIFESGSQELFYRDIFIFCAIFTFSFILIFLMKNFWTASYNRYRSSVEKKYFPLFVKLDQNTLETVGTGKSIAVLSKGIKMWGTLLDQVFIRISFLSISLGITSTFLYFVNPFLVVGFFVLLLISIYIGMWLSKKIVFHRNKRIQLDNIWSKNVVKIIMAKNEILQSNKIEYEVQNLHKLHEGQIFHNRGMATFLVPFYILGILIVVLLLGVVFLQFGPKYFSGEISLGIIAALSGAILLMQKEFTNLLDFIKNFARDFGEVQNMWDFFDTTPQIIGYEEGNIFEYKKGNIELKNITYSYGESKNIFEKFSAKIEGGNITALVGPSGGGKTTLVKLIAGYIRANSGEIMIDGQKLSETSLKSYYSQIGYLTQEPSVFDGTVRENLLYAVTEPHLNSSPQGEEEATEKVQSLSPGGERIQDRGCNEKLANIISLAQCEFIYDLPNGLDTEIGERGVKLSGGQKQRLAIAKIFLKNPKIIILDEPTSALDSVSELKITQALNNLFKHRTVLVIAHRLQTVKHADDIIVIENGKIIERGTHKQLVKLKGFYKQMLDLQSGF